jgi:hypothetical protein
MELGSSLSTTSTPCLPGIGDDELDHDDRISELDELDEPSGIPYSVRSIGCPVQMSTISRHNSLPTVLCPVQRVFKRLGHTARVSKQSATNAISQPSTGIIRDIEKVATTNENGAPAKFSK